MTRNSKKIQPVEIQMARAPLPWRAITAVLSIIAVGLVGAAGLDGLRQSAARLPAAQVARSQISVTPAPPWITGNFVDDVLQQYGSLHGEMTFMDGAFSKKLGSLFEQSPWVYSVQVSVRSQRVDVKLEYRQPVLSVPWKEWACYVSSDAVALPPDPQTRQQYLRECFGLVLREDVPPPRIGGKYQDERIITAARFAHALQPFKDELGLLSIVPLGARVAKVSDMEWEVRTVRGSRILWGRFDPSDETELLRRVAMLRAAAHPKRKLDAEEMPMLFDLTRSGRVVVSRPIPSGQK